MPIILQLSRRSATAAICTLFQSHLDFFFLPSSSKIEVNCARSVLLYTPCSMVGCELHRAVHLYESFCTCSTSIYSVLEKLTVVGLNFPPCSVTEVRCIISYRERYSVQHGPRLLPLVDLILLEGSVLVNRSSRGERWS